MCDGLQSRQTHPAACILDSIGSSCPRILSARRQEVSGWLQSSCGKQRASSDLFEDEIAIPVLGELPKNLGDGQTCFAQFA